MRNPSEASLPTVSLTDLPPMCDAFFTCDSSNDAKIRVLTDGALLRHFFSFQSGIPMPLYLFWLDHNPSARPKRLLNPFTGELAAQTSTPIFTKRGLKPANRRLYDTPASFRRKRLPDLPPPPKSLRTAEGLADLVCLVIKHGTLELLKFTPQIHMWIPQTAFKAALEKRDVGQQIIERSDVEMLQWALAIGWLESYPHHLWIHAVKHYRERDLRVLDALLEATTVPATALLRADVEASHITDSWLFQWLHEHVPGVVTVHEMMSVAVTRGDLAMVQHLCEEHGDLVCDLRFIRTAHDHGHLEVMEYLLENRPDLLSVETVVHVLVNGNAACVQVMKGSRGYTSYVEELVAREIGLPVCCMKLIPFFLENDLIPADARIPIDTFAASGQLDIIRTLHTKGVATAIAEAMDRAAENNHWDIVQFLHTNSTEGCTTRVMDAAAAHGRFDYFKYLHRHRSEGFSSRALELAAATGKIEFVRYILGLSDHGGCTTRAMAAAAQRGHLEIVKLLHEKRSEMCSWTMAATRGACQVHGAVREDDLNGASNREHPFKQVIENDHVDVVNFLYEHYPARFTPALLYSLLLHGVFDVWMHLRKLYPHEANDVVGDVLSEAGKLQRMKTIRFIVKDLGRLDLVHRVVHSAAKVQYARDAVWLNAVVSVTGEQSSSRSAIHAAIYPSEGWINVGYLKSLLSHASDGGAKDYAISLARERGYGYLVCELERWNEVEHPADNTTLQTFLIDPRASSWAISLLTGREDRCVDPYKRCSKPYTFAVRAVLHNDLPMLQLIHDMVLSSTFSSISADVTFTFDGTRAAAVRRGNLEMLQWLIETVELPIEPTLLQEAIEFQRYEIATWLVANCPPGCRKLTMSDDWLSNVKDPWSSVEEELLEWVEATSDVAAEVQKLILSLRVSLEDAANATLEVGL